MLVYSALATVVGFGGYFLLRDKSKSSSTLGPPSISVRESSRDGTSGEGRSSGPWRAVALPRASVAIPVRGRSYFAQVVDPSGAVAVVEGTWVGTKDHNRHAGALAVHRVVSLTHVTDWTSMKKPEVPFTLEIPPSMSELRSDYLQEVEHEILPPLDLGLSARSRRPAKGERVFFALREKEPGCATVVVEGHVVGPSQWPSEEGRPDARVLVEVDRIVRRIVGGDEMRLPRAIAVDPDRLIA